MIITGIFTLLGTLLGVILGFYLDRFVYANDVVSKTGKKIKNVLVKEKGYGEPFVVETDEASLEREQKKSEKEIIDVKDAIR